LNGTIERGSVFTRVITDVDLQSEGRHVGWLRIPNSNNDSAWGTIAIPIIVVRAGEGPTLLLTSGTHGDEYEGQIALCDLARTLQPQDIRGRVIIIPALHLPACLAGKRLSPLDGRDLNRSFPGDAGGSFAQVLAHYISHVIMPETNVVIDIHSGGRSLDCLPCTMSHILDDSTVMHRTVALARAFGAPFHVMNREVDGSRTFAATAEAQGIISMSSELGGSNRVLLEGVEIARRGVRNAMIHLGLMRGEIQLGNAPTRAMMIPSSGDYGFAPAAGIYCPNVPLGSWVVAGDLLGGIYRVEDPLADPVAVFASRNGMVWCQRGQGRIAIGDSAAVVVSDWSEGQK
jgi:predicted deacylase